MGVEDTPGHSRGSGACLCGAAVVAPTALTTLVAAG